MSITKQSIKQSIGILVDEVGKTSFWEIKNNPILTFPVRRVEVKRSPWYTSSCHNYCVCFYYNGNLMECENGLALDAAVKSVWSWYCNSGFLVGIPYEVEKAIMGAGVDNPCPSQNT